MEPQEPLVSIDEHKCKSCYACIRACPVKAIRTNPDKDMPEVIPSRCIGCGSCFKTCSPAAIRYRNSVGQTKALLTSAGATLAITSPAISGEFDDITDYRKFVQMIRQLGFTYVIEASFGADLVAHKYLELINNFRGKYYITANDPTVVSYIQKYKPALINNLAPVVSPMVASAKVARELYGKDIKVVYIGPLISSKDEAANLDDDGRIDAVLTFGELRQMFRDENITETTLEFSDFDPPRGYKGALFPLPNGILQAADFDENLLTSNFITVVGRNAMLRSLDEFEKHVDIIQRHLNVFYTDMLLGPGMSKRGDKLVRETYVIKYVNRRLQNFFRIEWFEQLQRFLSLNLSRQYAPDDQRLEIPSESDIQEALRQLNKSSGETIDCHKCGYNSCRDFAISMLQGFATPEMCVTNTTRKDIQHARSLKLANEKLAEAHKALETTEQKVRDEHQQAIIASEIANSVLQKLRAGVVIANRELKVLQTNPSLINILGDDALSVNEVIPGLTGADLKKLVPFELYKLFEYTQSSGETVENRDIRFGENIINVSIFPITPGDVVAAIIRDMSAPEVQKAEVINRLSDTIDKNLEMVQKIGFLLGENAAEIEKMLNSIIEFYRNANK